MTSKWTNISRRMLFAYFMLGGLIFLFTPARVTSRLQLAYASAFSGPLSTGHTLTLASRTPVTEVDATSDDIDRLRNDNAYLKVLLRDANDTINRLAQVRVQPAWSRTKLLPARVTVINPTQTEVIINCGRQDGVVAGHYVLALNDHSLVGRVCDVMSHTAKVRLISDPASRIPVEIGLADIQGVMEGRGDGIAKIPLVPTKRTVNVQDTVYARQQRNLDVPMVVGRVIECREDSDNPLLWDIAVRATCDVASLDKVAVVMPGP